MRRMNLGTMIRSCAEPCSSTLKEVTQNVSKWKTSTMRWRKCSLSEARSIGDSWVATSTAPSRARGENPRRKKPRLGLLGFSLNPAVAGLRYRKNKL